MKEIETKLSQIERLVAEVRERFAIEDAVRRKQREEKKDKIDDTDLRNKEAKTWQIVLSIIGSAILTGVLVWYYLK